MMLHLAIVWCSCDLAGIKTSGETRNRRASAPGISSATASSASRNSFSIKSGHEFFNKKILLYFSTEFIGIHQNVGLGFRFPIILGESNPKTFSGPMDNPLEGDCIHARLRGLCQTP